MSVDSVTSNLFFIKTKEKKIVLLSLKCFIFSENYNFHKNICFMALFHVRGLNTEKL